jgi:hypothetical protein
VLELGLDTSTMLGPSPLTIVSSRMAHPWDGLCRAYDRLGLDAAAGGDTVFRQLVLARVIEPTGKMDSLRVLTEVGLVPASYPTLERRLPLYAQSSWRHGVAAACALEQIPLSRPGEPLRGGRRCAVSRLADVVLHHWRCPGSRRRAVHVMASCPRRTKELTP